MAVRSWHIRVVPSTRPPVPGRLEARWLPSPSARGADRAGAAGRGAPARGLQRFPSASADWPAMIMKGLLRNSAINPSQLQNPSSKKPARTKEPNTKELTVLVGLGVPSLNAARPKRQPSGICQRLPAVRDHPVPEIYSTRGRGRCVVQRHTGGNSTWSREEIYGDEGRSLGYRLRHDANLGQVSSIRLQSGVRGPRATAGFANVAGTKRGGRRVPGYRAFKHAEPDATFTAPGTADSPVAR
jgi:hypothetical protein